MLVQLERRETGLGSAYTTTTQCMNVMLYACMDVCIYDIGVVLAECEGLQLWM